MDGYKLYIRVNEAGIIIHGFSDAFEQSQDGDILVLENGPRHFHLAWPEPLVNERGQYRYKWENGKRVERSQAELDEEFANLPPAPKTPEQERLDLIQKALDDLILGGAM